MPDPQRGEVWLADLGLAAKVRPVLMLSVPFSVDEYALATVVPHTTSPRGTRFEVSVKTSGLKAGAFNIQGMLALPRAKFIRRIDQLGEDDMEAIEDCLQRWLGLK